MKRFAFLTGITLLLAGALALAAQQTTAEQFSAHMAQMQSLMKQAQGTDDPSKHRELMQQHAGQMTQVWQLMSQMMNGWAEHGMPGSGGGSGMMGSKGGMGGQGMMGGRGKSAGPDMMQQHMQMLQMLMDQMKMHEQERMRMHDQ